MNRFDRHAIFAFLTVLVFGLFTLFQTVMSEASAKTAKKNAYQIMNAVAVYKESHEEKFPNDQSSNEVLRRFFQLGLVEDEILFATNRDEKSPDGNIGSAENGYQQALEEGECGIYYIRGLKLAPLKAKAPCLFYLRKTHGCNYWICGYLVKSFDKTPPEITSSVEFLNAEEVDLLSPDYWKQFGVDFKDVLAPEGYTLDVPALNRENQANRRVRWLILIPYGLFIIGDIVYFRYTRRKLRKSSLANS